MLRIALALSLMGSFLVFSSPIAAQEATLQRYERQYISFFHPQDYPLNTALAEAFARDFPRFSYHVSETSLQMDLLKFLREARAYQAQRAGDLAAGRESTDPRFDDKVVSWSDTEQIARAAWVFVPRWSFSEVTITGPTPSDSQNLEQEWLLAAESDVALEMGLYSLQEDTPRLYETLDNSWTVTRDKVFRVSASEVREAIARANAQISDADDKIKFEDGLSSSQRETVLGYLRQQRHIDQALRQVEAQDPTVYMMRQARESIGYGGVIADVRRLEAFLIRAEISEPDMQRDRVGISLGGGENADSLGIGLDEGYKVLEYVAGGAPREIGYVKIREQQGDRLISQPIIVGRDFELGDQVVEYPKAGIGFNLRGGAHYFLNAPLQQPSFLTGGGGLDLDFNIGPAFGGSETYLLFSGSVYNGYGLLEMGLQKKWYWRQAIFALGLRGGASVVGEDVWGGGVTGLAGFHWQFTPDFAIGLDTGWRQYLHFSGPVLETFIRFDL
ncbi:MAG: hypothetical protein ACO1RX_18260 [Candidatus Sericytochromatia bacterium]